MPSGSGGGCLDSRCGCGQLADSCPRPRGTRTARRQAGGGSPGKGRLRWCGRYCLDRNPQLRADRHVSCDQYGGRSPRVVAWTRSGERTYLCVYLVANVPPQIDFITIFERGSLTTGKSKDGQLLPNGPDRFLQTFAATTAVLWRRHEAGLKVLGAKRGLLPLATAGSLEQDFSDAVKMQASYIRSLPLWPLRIPYWYFVRRHLRHEKPVASRVHRS